ncbi:MAG: hypothetical protein LC739_12500 [Actinobacteria bacterium]|nr:hypothetical protein [Actinomycetota bacterium]
MSPRAAIGWAMWFAGLAAIAVSAYLSTKNPPISTTQTPESAVEGALWLSAWIGFGLVGAFLVTSRPRNRIGWILCGITFTLGLTLFAAAYARYALVTRAGALPFGAVAAWLATWTFVPLVFLVIALVALFPSGSAHSGAARWILRIGALVALLTAMAFAFRPGPVEGDTPPSNPLGISGTKPFLDNAIQILGTALGAVALAALIDGIVRFRRSSGLPLRLLSSLLCSGPCDVVCKSGLIDGSTGPASTPPAPSSRFRRGSLPISISTTSAATSARRRLR